MFKQGYIDLASDKLNSYLTKYPGKAGKALRHFFLWSLRTLLARGTAMKPIQDDTLRIAFLVNGGLGDKLLALNYILCFEESLDCRHEIDLYAVGDRNLNELRDLCRGSLFIQGVYSEKESKNHYDLVLDFLRFPFSLAFYREKVTRLSPHLAELVEMWDQFHRLHLQYFQGLTPADYLGMAYTLLNGRTRLSQGDIENRLGVTSRLLLPPEENEDEILTRLNLDSGPFLTLQRGVGGHNKTESNRLWPNEYYERLIPLLKAKWPTYRIVQIGAAETLPMRGVDLDLRGKTSFQELKVLLRRSACHIDGECGLVHLRHFLGGGPSAVIFGPTSEEFYGYPENINLQSKLCPRGCEWIASDYERRCPRGFDGCRGSRNIAPETVVQRIAEILL